MQARELRNDAVQIVGSTVGAPVISYVVDRDEWRLEEEYVATDGPTTIAVPAGYVFDLASVPRPLWSVIAPFELSVSAPLVHDFIYDYRGELPAGAVAPERTYTRKQSDVLFRQMMAAEQVPVWRRTLAYTSVRLFARYPDKVRTQG